jgi:CRP/FNR family transcriptional regulator, anaerobic regulatory protein
LETIKTYRNPCGACAGCEVRRTAICAALDDDEVGRLERIMTSRTLDANETLVNERDPRDRVFSLTSGMLRLSTALPDGRRQITGFLLPGDYLGLADDEAHSQTAEAVIPSHLCAFPVRGMDRLVEEHPRLKDRLHDMTRADIADYLGLTIETVSRSFTKLRTQGLIRLPDAHRVEIADRRLLAAVAGMEFR